MKVESLSIGARSWEFTEPGELADWIGNELARWAWLTSASEELIRYSSRFEAFARLDQLHVKARDPESYTSELLEELSELFQEKSIIYSQSAKGRFCASVAAQNPTLAASILAYFLGSLEIPESAVDYEAICSGVLYRKGISKRSRPETKELEDVKRNWHQVFRGASKKLRSLEERSDLLLRRFEERTRKVDRALQEVPEKHLGKLRHQVEEAMRAADEARQMTASQLDELVEKTHTSMKGLKASFQAETALKAPVAYWKDKRESHTDSSRNYLKGTLITAPIVAILLSVSAWSFLGRGPAIDVRGAGLFIVIATMGFWLLRVMVKLYTMHVYLETDARERIVLIQTYLALLTEGVDATEEEKKIVMSSLFRPAANIMADERESYTAIETLGKMVRGGK